jgi:hypothetical protein
MIRAIAIILFLVIVYFLASLTGCASSSVYISKDNCSLAPDGSYYICYYVQNGSVRMVKKSFDK